MPYTRRLVLTLLAAITAVSLTTGCPVYIPVWPADNDNSNANDNTTDDPLDPNDNTSDDPANDNTNDNTEDDPADPPPDGPVEPQVGEVTLDLGDGVSMVLALIPSGTFSMGTDSTDHAALDRSRPVHTVTIAEDFYIGRYEVTQAQWQATMGDSPSSFTGSDILPVESISWAEAIAFCEAASIATGYTITLPTDAQWEYACRAGATTAYSFGDDRDDLDQYGWYLTNGALTTHDVGGKLPNFWNLYDMHGNVLEWCLDTWHADYTDAPQNGSAWTQEGDDTLRVLRGGAWYSIDFNLRSDYRFKYDATDDYHGIGFRVVAVP